MHPYVILKQPGKAILYLSIIMISFLVKDANSMGECSGTCFGPVSKVKIYNELALNYVHVVGNTVVANDTENDRGTLYKISAGASFYLYDDFERKFICFRKGQKKTMLVARKFRRSLPMRLCEFQEKVAEFSNKTHVEYVSAYDNKLKMNFNKRGKSKGRCTSPSPKRGGRGQGGHRERHQTCAKSAAFLVSHSCTCTEAKSHFCLSELRNMKELRDVCNSVKFSRRFVDARLFS